MGVRQNPIILSEEAKLIVSGGGNDHLIGRIAVKRLRQLRRFDGNLRGERQKLQVGLRECPGNPNFDWLVQHQTTVLDQLGHFPAGYYADAESFSWGFKKSAVRFPQAPLIGHPPYPDVGIEQNQFAASQSPNATGSNGRS